MSFSGFSKEILDYTRACEHLIGESLRRDNHFNHFSEDELHLINYYADEVDRFLRESMSRKRGQVTGRTSGTVEPKS